MISFPKPVKTKRKVIRELNPDYVWWIHSWPCVICKKWPVQAHHVVPRSRLGADLTCIPLCHNHHVGDNGVHIKGVLHFEKSNLISFDEQVSKYNKLYADGVMGPEAHLLPARDGFKGKSS